jgi:exopolyphosphatase/guanosine-5'-triphosphate,3'-diphosphate pyrophosphatase
VTGFDKAPAAAVDCGSNSTRLLVADPERRALERLMRITRLGEGVDRDRILASAAVGRTVSVLEEYRKVMDRHGVDRVRMTATSAVRDAGNRDEFLAAATAAIGVAPEILTGEAEARLSFAGATAELDDADAPWLVLDIGGGSTELAAGGPHGEPAVRSLDVGCVRITERFLQHDPPLPAELDAARSEVHRLLAGASSELPVLSQAATLVGLAGTVAGLAAVDQGLDTYDRDRLHHYRLARSRVDTMAAELAAVPARERALRPGVEPGRADVLHGGALILSVVMEYFGFRWCLTSEADILDGLIQTLVG